MSPVGFQFLMIRIKKLGPTYFFYPDPYSTCKTLVLSLVVAIPSDSFFISLSDATGRMGKKLLDVTKNHVQKANYDFFLCP